MYNLTNQPVLLKSPLTINLTPELLSITTCTSTLSSDNNHCIKSQKPKSKTERFKLMKEIAGSLAQVGHMVTNERFDRRLELLQQIDDAWRQNKEIRLDQLSSSLSTLSISAANDSQECGEVDPSSIIMPTSLKLRGRPKDVFQSTAKIHQKKGSSKKC